MAEAPSNYNLPGNSKKAKEEKEVEEATPERAKREQIVATAGVVRKKPWYRKFTESFVGDDAQSVGSYIMGDVILPALKNTISDAVSQGIERMLFGDVRGRINNGRRQGSNYTNYNTMSRNSSNRPTPGENRRDMTQRGRAVHDFDEVILSSRGEAELVLSELIELVTTFDVATVTDLYDLVGITGKYTDDRWGWYDLRGVGVTHVREGYLLNLPKPEPVD